jgi:hypothetical protein
VTRLRYLRDDDGRRTGNRAVPAFLRNVTTTKQRPPDPERSNHISCLVQFGMIEGKRKRGGGE